MPEISLTRDCYIIGKGDTFTATISSEMATTGWVGGQGVRYTSSPKDELTVTYSDGLYNGFLPFGSNETSDQHTSMTGQNPFYRYAVVGTGNWIVWTVAYEKYTYASRQSGPLVSLTYSPSDKLLFSLRGLFTSQDEWALSSDPRAPNGYYIAFVMVPPSAATDGRMLVQVSL